MLLLLVREGFAARLAALLPGLGFCGNSGCNAGIGAAQNTGGVQKLDGDGKPPAKVHHSADYSQRVDLHRRTGRSFARQPNRTPARSHLEMHTQMVMDGRKGRR